MWNPKHNEPTREWPPVLAYLPEMPASCLPAFPADTNQSATFHSTNAWLIYSDTHASSEQLSLDPITVSNVFLASVEKGL